MEKIAESADAVITRSIRTGQSVAVGGFGLCGTPTALLQALIRSGADELHIVTNNCGPDSSDLSRLLRTGRVRKVTASYIGDNTEFLRRYVGGSIEVDLVPQGTLAEKLRCGGAGIPAFYTPTGAGTAVAVGQIPTLHTNEGTIARTSTPRQLAEFDGGLHILERSLTVDVALIRAETADRMGNLRFRGSARNFNPLCAMAGRTTLVEVQQVVAVGDLQPDDIHLPGIFVSEVVDLAGGMAKPIERRRTAIATSEARR